MLWKRVEISVKIHHFNESCLCKKSEKSKGNRDLNEVIFYVLIERKKYISNLRENAKKY